MKLKQSRRSLINNLNNKQNSFVNIFPNSKSNSRRRLKSIEFTKAQMKSDRSRSQRYQDQENICTGNTIQLPTFGDWKQIKNFKPKDHVKDKQNTVQIPVPSTTNTQESERQSNRVKRYRQSKLRQIQIKPMCQEPLSSIQNIMTTKFTQKLPIEFQFKVNDVQKQRATVRHRKGSTVGESLSSRARALSRQFENFDSIENSLHKIINRKQIFKGLYLKQKEKYESILRKHNIHEKVDDTEFENYFNQ